MKVQKEFQHGKDIAESIRNMELVDLTVLKPQIGESQEIDPAKRRREESVGEKDL